MSSTVTIDPVTRIEGHAKITLALDKAGKVDTARFSVTEATAICPALGSERDS
jgi:NAD-reducing hydrogenase large subunit